MTIPRIDVIISLYNEGLSCKAIATKYNCNPVSIWKRLKKLGLTRQHKDAVASEHARKLMSIAAKKRILNYNPMKDPIIRIKMAVSQTGAKNHRWLGGKSNSYRYGLTNSQYLKLSEKVKKHFNRTCQRCNKKEGNGIRLHMHHIDGDKNNNSFENLTCVCVACHNILHKELKKKGAKNNENNRTQAL